MDYPKMILFDYGQTLIDEEGFDRLKGTKALLSIAIENPNNISAEEICKFSNELNIELGRENREKQLLCDLEIHNYCFQNYLYEYFGIEFDFPQSEVEKIFWDEAAPGKPTENIEELLDFLHEKGIRTGVISNITNSGENLKSRIDELLPNNHFEFIIASSDYMFRKPNRRLFELALRKAGLPKEEVWFCGDNVICDVEGASQNGLIPIWYKGAVKEQKYIPMVEHIEISNWLELKDLLEK